jgi:hypothetical protein
MTEILLALLIGLATTSPAMAGTAIGRWLRRSCDSQDMLLDTATTMAMPS